MFAGSGTNASWPCGSMIDRTSLESVPCGRSTTIVLRSSKLISRTAIPAASSRRSTMSRIAFIGGRIRVADGRRSDMEREPGRERTPRPRRSAHSWRSASAAGHRSRCGPGGARTRPRPRQPARRRHSPSRTRGAVIQAGSRHDPSGPRRCRVRRTPCRAASMTRSDSSVGPTSTQSRTARSKSSSVLMPTVLSMRPSAHRPREPREASGWRSRAGT